MLGVFKILYWFATILGLTTAVLVTASLFISDYPPQASGFLYISLFVSGIFLGLSVLTFGVQRHVGNIAKLTAGNDQESALALKQQVFRLQIYLVCGGAVLCAFLTIATFAILERINQGFAVFG